jgi:multiple sugar transport system ATP-binding protein
MAPISISRISKAFETTPVLRDISIDIADGEFISLVGPSGCGKSTLLRIIAGLEIQSGGEVRIAGTSVDRVRPSARNLAMVFQSYALYPHLTVFDNIAVPLRMKRLTALDRLPLVGWAFPARRRVEATIRRDVEAVAALLGINALLHRKPRQLSGGQRQRVALGRAIVREPAAFLLDEPLSNLDAKLRVHMRSELVQLHRRLKTTFIYVTHDQVEAMTMSDRIAVMFDGELVQVGAPSAIYQSPADLRVAEFIGSPKINVLPAAGRNDGGIEVLGLPIGVAAERAGGNCRVGVRPEHIRIGAQAAAFSGTVLHSEFMGAEAFVHIGCENLAAPVVARVGEPGLAPAVGTSIAFSFAPEAAHVFDAAGRRVPAQGRAVRLQEATFG